MYLLDTDTLIYFLKENDGVIENHNVQRQI